MSNPAIERFAILPPGIMDTEVRKVFRYRPEREEIVRTIQHMTEHLEKHGCVEGDCDDIATFIASILKAGGRPARFVAIDANGDGEFDHVYTEGLIHGRWVVFDPTVPAGTLYDSHATLMEYV